MKHKTLIIALALVAGLSAAPARASEKPVIESFTYTPKEVDASNFGAKVTFELVVSHPFGIENISTLLSLKSGASNLTAYLVRTDSTLTNQKVIYRGSLDIPADIAAGAYAISINPLKNNSSAGYQYETEAPELPKTNSVIGAETSLLIRNGGDLNLTYQTFVGPTYDSALSSGFKNTAKYNSAAKPIFRVGEKYILSDYFELQVPSLSLKVSSTTPTICSTSGNELTFQKEGTCAFTVFTEKSKDYASKKLDQTVTILGPRVKPQLTIDKVADKLATDVGKTIELPHVYSYYAGWVFGKSTTPSVCVANTFFVKLLSVGTCNLSYQTEPTTSTVASDLYNQTFIVGSPTPEAIPTTAPTPVTSKNKSVTCVKSKMSTKGPASRKVTGTNPKCPTGYKLKK